MNTPITGRARIVLSKCSSKSVAISSLFEGRISLFWLFLLSLMLSLHTNMNAKITNMLRILYNRIRKLLSPYVYT